MQERNDQIGLVKKYLAAAGEFLEKGDRKSAESEYVKIPPELLDVAIELNLNFCMVYERHEGINGLLRGLSFVDRTLILKETGERSKIPEYALIDLSLEDLIRYWEQMINFTDEMLNNLVGLRKILSKINKKELSYLVRLATAYGAYLPFEQGEDEGLFIRNQEHKVLTNILRVRLSEITK